MKTKTFTFTTDTEGESYIKELVYDWTISFHKLYKNLELHKDENYLDTLRIKDAKLQRDLIEEVKAFEEAVKENIKTIENNIKERNEELKNLNKKKCKKKTKDRLKDKKYKKILKLERKLKKLLNKGVIFGDTDLYEKLSKNNFETDKEKLECQLAYSKSRQRFIVYYGECSREGNRNFDFKELTEGIIIFKPCRGIKIRLKLNNFNKNTLKELSKLQAMIFSKEIPVTVKLNDGEIQLSYDESKLSHNFKDLKKFYTTINHIKDKEARKPLVAKFHKEHEVMLKTKYNKLNRHMGIDMNPLGIGFAIGDIDSNNKIKFIKTGYIDFTSLQNFDANKRNHFISLGIKELFKIMKHYRCSHLDIEDLKFDNSKTNHGNKVSNRKINNIWNRGLINHLINRRCNEEGIILGEVNPAFTSLIGNIIYKQYDPIASSMMILRRGIFQYTKFSEGNVYPIIDVNHFINDSMYDDLKVCRNWRELALLFCHPVRSFRRELSESTILQENYLRDKSVVKLFTTKL